MSIWQMFMQKYLWWCKMQMLLSLQQFICSIIICCILFISDPCYPEHAVASPYDFDHCRWVISESHEMAMFASCITLCCCCCWIIKNMKNPDLFIVAPLYRVHNHSLTFCNNFDHQINFYYVHTSLFCFHMISFHTSAPTFITCKFCTLMIN